MDFVLGCIVGALATYTYMVQKQLNEYNDQKENDNYLDSLHKDDNKINLKDDN